MKFSDMFRKELLSPTESAPTHRFADETIRMCEDLTMIGETLDTLSNGASTLGSAEGHEFIRQFLLFRRIEQLLFRLKHNEVNREPDKKSMGYPVDVLRVLATKHASKWPDWSRNRTPEQLAEMRKDLSEWAVAEVYRLTTFQSSEDFWRIEIDALAEDWPFITEKTLRRALNLTDGQAKNLWEPGGAAAARQRRRRAKRKST